MIRFLEFDRKFRVDERIEYVEKVKRSYLFYSMILFMERVSITLYVNIVGKGVYD